MRPKTYSVKEVYDSTYLGFTFEFYCSKRSSFIVEDFQKITGKNVVLTDETTIEPTYTSAILMKEYDGERPRYQFKVAAQPYKDVPTFLNTMLFWINESATLDYSTLLKTKLFYNFNSLNTLQSISNMDVGKMVLKMDESFLHERFPEISESPFSMSIKKLVPFNMSVNASQLVNLKTSFKMPVAEYYGVDFTAQTRGELTFNYIGGPEYSDRVKEVYEVLEYYIFTTYQVLNEANYTPTMMEELNKLTEEYRKFRRCYYSADKFMENYKDITVYIDLNKGPALVEAHWFQIRDILAKLILESNVKQCKFNLDTETGDYQIKDAIMENSVINGFQIVNSNVSGVLERCHFWKTKINNSRVIYSTFVNRNEINESYIENTRADKTNKINESYIVNSGEIINCEVTDSVIKNAGIGDKAKLDENCLVINPRQEVSQKSSAIDVKEIRDYKWIKTLRDPGYKDEGFANEYKDNE